MVELMEQLYELARKSHANCGRVPDEHCFMNGYVTPIKQIIHENEEGTKEHLILRRAWKMLAEMKKY